MQRAKTQHILVINGHPDPSPERLCAALAESYARGAEAAGHAVERLSVGDLTFPLVRSLKDYQTSPYAPDIEAAQEAIKRANHLVLVCPIWFGAIPAYLKGFFEQILRSGFSLSTPEGASNSLLNGKSARVIVTMGMPLSLFRWVLGSHGLKSLERGLFWATGISPIRHTLFGRAMHAPRSEAAKWLAQVETLGRRGV
jgi:putative NADPH-quinone reductase